MNAIPGIVVLNKLQDVSDFVERTLKEAAKPTSLKNHVGAFCKNVAPFGECHRFVAQWMLPARVDAAVRAINDCYATRQPTTPTERRRTGNGPQLVGLTG